MRLTIESVAYGGDAIAHLEDGRAAFVSGAAPGDVVNAEIVSDHGRFVRARTVEVLDPSPDRVEPRCPYFELCGGCQWQHISYEAQLRAKTAAVEDSLRRIGRLDPGVAVNRCIGSPRQYGYRNKVELPVHATDSGVTLGMHKMGTEEIVGIDACLLLPDRALKIPKAVRGALRYLSGRDPGGIERVAIRVADRTRDIEVALWSAPGPMRRDTVAKVIGEATGAGSIVRVLYKGDLAKRRAEKVEVLRGKGAWSERMSGHRYLVSAPSFFQTNTAAAEALVAHVVETISPDGTDRVLDAYAGVGTFTLPFTERAGEAVAIEASRFAIADLNRNLEAAQAFAQVVPGDMARELPGLGRFDAIVVDPPRSGLSNEARAAILASRPARMSYVSCDPTTLARDLPPLVDAGYRIADITPFDLFPQTFHVETVVLLERS